MFALGPTGVGHLGGFAHFGARAPAALGYRFFKIEPVEIRELTADPSWQLAEVTFYDSLGNPIDLSGATATNPDGDGGQNPEHPEEAPDSAIDGDVDTKFLDHLIQPLVIELPAAVQAGAWSYTTANDSTERDIVQWRLLGSRDGEAWKVLQWQLADYEVTTDRHVEVGPFSFAGSDPEIVVNGGFSADADWTKGAGITIADGVATLPNNSNFLEQGIPTVQGETYRVFGECAQNGVFCGAWAAAGQNSELSSSSATRTGWFHFDFVADGSTSYIAFSAAGGDAVLDNVSCQRVA